MRLLDSIMDSMDMNSEKLQEIVEDIGAWWAAVSGVAQSRTRLKRFSSSSSSLYHHSALTSMATGKTTAMTIQTSVGKVMSLLFNMLSRLIIAFLPRSKHLLI